MKHSIFSKTCTFLLLLMVAYPSVADENQRRVFDPKLLDNSTIPTQPVEFSSSLTRSKSVLATYSPDQKEKLLNALLDTKLKDLKSLDAVDSVLGDARLIESFKQDLDINNSEPNAKINWKKVIYHIAQIIEELTK